MSQCDKCGYPLPDGAEYCPNCGSSIKKREVPAAPPTAIGKILQIGFIGAFLSITISSFSPGNVDLYFIPSFIASLAMIYIARSRRLDQAVTISLSVYVLADGIMAGIALGTLYVQDVPLARMYGDYVPTLLDVIMYAASPVTAFIAGYVGARLAPEARVKKTWPTPYGREEGSGGIVYSLEEDPEGTGASAPHKV